MSNVPQKIVLKSTTKISLNERFSNIAKMAPAAPAMTTSPGDRIRAQMAAQQLATAKNRRLAQQMANRPSVQAALKLKKRSLKQRLGNVQSRLSGRQNLPQGTLRGGIRGAIRGQRGFRSRGRGFQRGGRGSLSGSVQSLDTITSGNSFNTIHSRGGSGFRRPNWNRGRVARGANPRGNTRGMNTGTRGSPRGQGRGRGMRAQRSRGNQGNRGRGRGRGAPRGRGGPGQSVTRELLDDQLEEYMSKTQSYLDAEMDQYMGGGDS